MSAAFTKGPWVADFGETFRIREADGSSVAYTQFVHLKGRRDTEEVQANARLIAAAPELYEALDKLIEVCVEQGFAVGPHGRVAIGMDALRKARGDA